MTGVGWVCSEGEEAAEGVSWAGSVVSSEHQAAVHSSPDSDSEECKLIITNTFHLCRRQPPQPHTTNTLSRLPSASARIFSPFSYTVAFE